MNLEREIAHDLLSIGAVFLRPDEPFTWASGIKSPIYCDNRLTLTAPAVRTAVEKGLVELIRTHYPDVEVLMGTSTAGIAHAAIVGHLMDLPMGYVRSGNKDHGRQNRIEGRLEKGQKVVVVEDLISTAGSCIEVVEALRSYGLDTGLAFQIQDDLLNLVGTDEAKKKDFRSDITEGKRTLVVVHALQNTEPAARERLVEILSSKERDPEVLAEAVAIMEKTGSIDYARTFAEDLTLNAKARLAGALPPSPYRDLLVSMADWFVNRLK